MAAVDLGSNSFHMVVARLQHGQLAIVDRLREMVRLASGLTPYGYLDSASQERALACLRRFGQRLRDMDARQVRVVGTSTLRRASHSESFLAAAEQALGHPVDVISGIEEARLIYLGVSHHVERVEGSTFVADIGGGSTELIIGQGYEPRHLESLSVGCVELSRECFGDGRITRKRFDRARLAARLELRPITAAFKRIGWAQAVGSSGTVRAVGDVAHELGLCDRGIDMHASERIIDELVDARRVDALRLPGVGPERAPVFPGGVAILVEIMAELGIEHLEVSDGALREGLLYDMVGRLHHEDARERTIRAMQRRYHVDEEQAHRVESTVKTLLGRVARAWELDADRYRQLVEWAAKLHEVGLDIAHSKYHQHGGYLLANADLPGFVRVEQQLLATLVGSHRKKLDDLALDRLPEIWRRPAFRLLVLLRLAVLLNRGRGPIDLPNFEIVPGADVLELRFPERWYADNPLTHADLEQERVWLRARGFELKLAL
ncbi:MAG TPA: Ppx/GppA phosphatase family protein [Gammaproteobacteria bacterium]|nr:Ppx/GppA phosphatase family protein [Gammaproteobacteria bacterium]